MGRPHIGPSVVRRNGLVVRRGHLHLCPGAGEVPSAAERAGGVVREEWWGYGTNLSQEGGHSNGGEAFRRLGDERTARKLRFNLARLFRLLGHPRVDGEN